MKIKLKETLFKEWEGVSEKRVIKKKKKGKSKVIEAKAGARIPRKS